MLNFQAVRNNQISFAALVADLTPDDRRGLPRAMIDTMLTQIADAPHLDNGYEIWPDRPPVNVIGRFVLGLMHYESHLGQISDIVRQGPGGAEVVGERF